MKQVKWALFYWRLILFVLNEYLFASHLFIKIVVLLQWILKSFCRIVAKNERKQINIMQYKQWLRIVQDLIHIKYRMAQEPAMAIQDLCEFSEEEMKTFWCKNLRNDTTFLETFNLTHHHEHCIDVNSDVEHCLTGNYTNSFVEKCHDER